MTKALRWTFSLAAARSCIFNSPVTVTDAFIIYKWNLPPFQRQSVALYSSHKDSYGGVRLNKAFRATHSRRDADALISDGRVRVNGKAPESMGIRLFPGDVVTLDGKPVYWERLNQEKSNGSAAAKHTYVKYWKPRGVECTTSRHVKGNIIDSLGPLPGVSDRLFPVGRLDKDSTGLILLTSDGDSTQRVLKSTSSNWKTYLVETHERAPDKLLETLSKGVRISSKISHDGKKRIQWLMTQEAIVQRGPNVQKYPNQLLFKIREGKNRQIRQMCEAVGLLVTRLHRVGFADITLDGCAYPGSWAFLTEKEIKQLVGT